jgi:hypothetical protein
MARYYSNQEPDWEIILANVYNWNSFYNWLIIFNIAEILAGLEVMVHKSIVI